MGGIIVVFWGLLLVLRIVNDGLLFYAFQLSYHGKAKIRVECFLLKRLFLFVNDRLR